MSTGLPDWLQPFEPEETDGDPIGTSQEATAEPSTNDAKRAMAIRTVNTGREAVGLPPLKKPRVHLPRRTGESIPSRVQFLETTICTSTVTGAVRFPMMRFWW